jgi:anti-sigma B factor antagonist
MIDGADFAITSERTGTTVRIIASGELDIATASQLREHTDRQLADHADLLVLDLAAISFIDSSGLHAILDAANHGRDRLQIVASAACVRLFDLAGLRGRLPLLDSEGQAQH